MRLSGIFILPSTFIHEKLIFVYEIRKGVNILLILILRQPSTILHKISFLCTEKIQPKTKFYHICGYQQHPGFDFFIVHFL